MKSKTTTQHISSELDMAAVLKALHQLSKKPTTEQIYLIRNSSRLTKVKLETICSIVSRGKYTCFCCKDEKFGIREYLNDEGIHQVYEQLDHSLFFQCHRQRIINLEQVIECVLEGRAGYVIFDDGPEPKIANICFAESHKDELIRILKDRARNAI